MRITFGVIANHFDKLIRQIFVTANYFWPMQITFQMDLPKDLFFGPHLFFKQNFTFFRQILCIEFKNAYKLRIMICNGESLSQRVSQSQCFYQKIGKSLFVS